MPVLTRFAIDGLFGRFDHEIPLDNPKQNTIIIAPNGYGKTVILNLINHFFNRNFLYSLNIEFSRASFLFSDNTSINITKNNNRGNARSMQISLKSGDGNRFYTVREKSANEIEQILSGRIRKYDENRWVDYETEEMMTEAELIKRYGSSLSRSDAESEPIWLTSRINANVCKMIETQRLLQIERMRRNRLSYSSLESQISTTIESYATDLSKRMKGVSRKYLDSVQELDQTFPKRAIFFESDKSMTEENIFARLNELSDKYQTLISLGLSTQSVGQPIQVEDMPTEVTSLKFLSVYVQDTETKLEVFDEIIEQIHLFREIVNQHLRYKSLVFSQDNGFGIVDDDSGRSVPISALSSGEQHEIVLIYDLIFITEPKSWVLIDEPEISLHVGWQRSFFKDIFNIQRIKDFRVITATHSPQIIDDNWDCVIDLGLSNEEYH